MIKFPNRWDSTSHQLGTLGVVVLSYLLKFVDPGISQEKASILADFHHLFSKLTAFYPSCMWLWSTTNKMTAIK